MSIPAYTHGYQAPVIAHHGARTAANSAAFLLPHLRPDMHLLDVGCGPGSITLDLAQAIYPGTAIGIDPSPAVIDIARAAADTRGTENVSFEVGNLFEFDEPARPFDVVYAHQVLQHLAEPVGALRAMRSQLCDDGLLAVRDADYSGMIWAPHHPMLNRWMELYHQVTAHNGAEADAGRWLLFWVREAGFRDARATTSTWTYATPESRQWWGEGWSKRALESDFATQAISYDLTDQSELEAISAAWRWWADQPDSFFAIIHVDVLARR